MELLELVFRSFWSFIGTVMLVTIIGSSILKYQKTRLQAKVLCKLGYKSNPIKKANNETKNK